MHGKQRVLCENTRNACTSASARAHRMDKCTKARALREQALLHTKAYRYTRLRHASRPIPNVTKRGILCLAAIATRFY